MNSSWGMRTNNAGGLADNTIAREIDLLNSRTRRRLHDFDMLRRNTWVSRHKVDFFGQGICVLLRFLRVKVRDRERYGCGIGVDSGRTADV